MASTNKTTNFNLPQWVGTDKPTWQGDLNSAFLTIDTQMQTNKTNSELALQKNQENKNLIDLNTANIGVLNNLNTTDKTNLVNAINEVNESVETGKIGNLNDLNTINKGNVVSAINEVNTKTNNAINKSNANGNNIGNLSNLNTTNKTNLVNAINEINDNFENSLTFTNKKLTSGFTISSGKLQGGELNITKSNDESVIKIWGNILINTIPSGGKDIIVTIPASLNPLNYRPSSDRVIGCIGFCWSESLIFSVDATLKTNGDIKIRGYVDMSSQQVTSFVLINTPIYIKFSQI